MAAVIVICINHIQVNLPHTVAHRIVKAVNHQVVHPIAEAASHQAVQLRVHLETIVALVVAVVRKLEQRQRVIHQKANIIIILMMMDMTISIWMEIMTTTDMIETAIMQMAWMMRWMNLEKIGRLEAAYYGRNVFYNSRM